MNDKLLSDVALAFTDRAEFGTQLSRALQVLCSGLQLSRAYFYLDGPNRSTMGYTHEWCAKGVKQQWMQDILYSSYLPLKRTLAEQGCIVAADTSLLIADLHDLFGPHGIKALQAYPIEFEEQLLGFIGFDDVRIREWSDDEIHLLSSAASIISAFCDREIMREQYKVMKEIPAEVDDGEVIHDPLTGTFNRRYVFNRLVGFDAEYARLGRNFCITLVDIDQLDVINDKYGREAGDYVLKEFASIISNSIRPYDLSGRYGEDEFIIVSVNASALETGYLVERIRTAIKSHLFKYQEYELHPLFSYGIADSSEFSPENLSISTMVELAAQRLMAEMTATP